MTSTGPSAASRKRAPAKKTAKKAPAMKSGARADHEIGRAIHRELRELRRLLRTVEVEVRKVAKRAERDGRQLTQGGTARAIPRKAPKKVTKTSRAKKATAPK